MLRVHFYPVVYIIRSSEMWYHGVRYLAMEMEMEMEMKMAHFKSI
jgi:hypothetical protein